MSPARLQHQSRHNALNPFRLLAGEVLAATLLLVGVACVARGQERVMPPPSKPTKIYTVQGQVSLPEGRGAERVIVTLSTRAGVPRQAYTNELGRFEFTGIDEGGYTLTARSLSDPALRSEIVEADTSRTATGNLNVNLILRRESSPSERVQPAGVVTAAEAEQKVPREALRAFKEGIKLRKNRETDKALQSFTRAVEIYPGYFQALAARGDLRIFQRQLASAAADFASALKFNPRYGPALRGAGYCELERREFAEAVKDFEKALAVEPDNANTYLLVGIAYLELDRRDAAKASLVKALSFNSRHELRAYIYLANLYARERQYREAAEELHKYLEANPADPDASALKTREARWRSLAASP